MKGEEKGWGIGTCRELLKIALKGRKQKMEEGVCQGTD